MDQALDDPVVAPTKVYHHSIDGLRAVAVLLVVLFHAEVPGFSHGYLGVDMFLAISGFLITTRLVRRPDSEHLTPLREFWAGRARRILPAATVIIVVTCLVSAVVLAPQELERVGFYGFTSSLFVTNIAAAARGGDYFAGPLRDSPFLHMWSLGLEEQFYLLWPLVLGPFTAFAYRLTRRVRDRRPSHGAVLAAVLMVTLVVSFAVHVDWTRSLPLWAFYGLLPRMYEFVLGGIAALFLAERLPHAFRVPLTVFGAAVIVLALFEPWGSGTSPLLMLAASGGTVAIMLGTAPTPTLAPPRTPIIQPALESTPMAYIGRYSYSWYLWHWPAFVLTLAIANGTRIWAQIACVLSLLPAIVAFHFVEQPVRLSPWLRRSWKRSLVMGAVLVGVGAAVSVALVLWGRVGIRDAEIARLIEAEESFVTAGCEADTMRFGVQVCLGGSDSPDAPAVLLVGDSHASQWAAAYGEVGRELGLAIAVRASGSCPAAGIRTEEGEPQAYLDSCAAFQTATAELIASGDFAAVITSDAVGSRPSDPREWSKEMVVLTEVAAEAGTPIGMMIDNPDQGQVLRCLSRGHGESACRVSKWEATTGIRQFASAVETLVRETNLRRLDLSDEICPDDPCPIEIDGVIVPARASHLNREFTHTLSSELSDFLRSLVSEGTES